MEKKTKVVYFTELKDIVTNALGTEAAGEYLDFIDRELGALEKRRANQKAREDKRKAENDEMARAILDMLTDEPATNADILEEINDPEATPAKITARLSKLAREGLVAKETIKVDGKKRVAYTRIGYTELPMEEGPELDLEG